MGQNCDTVCNPIANLKVGFPKDIHLRWLETLNYLQVYASQTADDEVPLSATPSPSPPPSCSLTPYQLATPGITALVTLEVARELDMDDCFKRAFSDPLATLEPRAEKVFLDCFHFFLCMRV